MSTTQMGQELQVQQYLNGVRIKHGKDVTHKTVNRIKDLSKDIGTRYSKTAMVFICFNKIKNKRNGEPKVSNVDLYSPFDVKRISNIKSFDIKRIVIDLLFNRDLCFFLSNIYC